MTKHTANHFGSASGGGSCGHIPLVVVASYKPEILESQFLRSGRPRRNHHRARKASFSLWRSPSDTVEPTCLLGDAAMRYNSPPRGLQNTPGLLTETKVTFDLMRLGLGRA